MKKKGRRAVRPLLGKEGAGREEGEVKPGFRVQMPLNVQVAAALMKNHNRYQWPG